MKVKRIIAVLLAVIIAIAAVPVQVRAEEVYTVTLKAGEGILQQWHCLNF